MQKVFISSVIEGFEAERNAARSAVESIPMKPVMAEDFGAKPISPQAACLAGVRGSDLYIGIFGHRYGHVASSGIPATEEEFNEARDRGIPIFLFVQNCEPETRQKEFLAQLSVSGYEDGYHINRFDMAVELASKITKSISDFFGPSDTLLLDTTAAANHAKKHTAALEPTRHEDPTVAQVIFPARQGDPYLSVTDLGTSDMKDKLLQPALFGATALFRKEHGVRTEEGREHLAYLQSNHQGKLLTKIEFHPDGTLVWRCSLAEDQSHQFSAVRLYVIDQKKMHAALSAFLCYAHNFLIRSPNLS